MSTKSDGKSMNGLVDDVVQDALAAINAEAVASYESNRSAVEVRNGRPVGKVAGYRLWTFDFEGNLPVPAETPARLLIPHREPVNVLVLAVGDLDLVLGMGEEVTQDIPRARLSADPWFILDFLRKRLEALVEEGADVDLAEALLDLGDLESVETPACGASALDHVPLRLGADQRHAALHATGPGLRFVWGPPGTGKTSALAATVALLARSHRDSQQEPSVLVTAHANAAVDVAMDRIAEAHQGRDLLVDGRILRVGVPHLDVARDRHEILPDEIIRRRHPDLIARRDQLEEERRKLSRRLKTADSMDESQRHATRLEEVLRELAGVKADLREAYTALIEDAVVIGTTLSRLVLDNLVWARRDSGVVVDEVSMSGLPFLLAIALRGTSTLACFGDFRQLPPISISNDDAARLWFARDAFELAGVESRHEIGAPDPRLAILRTQYRMGSDIAELVSGFAYGGLLRTDGAAAQRARALSSFPPEEGTEIVVVDTTDLATTALRDSDPESFSRFNLLSAAVTATTVRILVDAGANSVGVVTPYRAQARLLQAVLHGSPETVVATAHRFQGSERDVMVLDLTDAEPFDGPSLLTGRDPDLARRLLNVAVSRARGKLVLVADLEFLRTRHPLTSPARQLFEAARRARTISATDLVRGSDDSSAVVWWDNWDQAMADLANRRWSGLGHLEVSLNDESQAGPWFDELVHDAADESLQVTLRAPMPVAVRLESTNAEIRLRALGPGPLAFAGNGVLVAGSRHSQRPAISIASEPAVLAGRRLLVAE